VEYSAISAPLTALFISKERFLVTATSCLKAAVVPGLKVFQLSMDVREVLEGKQNLLHIHFAPARLVEDELLVWRNFCPSVSLYEEATLFSNEKKIEDVLVLYSRWIRSGLGYPFDEFQIWTSAQCSLLVGVHQGVHYLLAQWGVGYTEPPSFEEVRRIVKCSRNRDVPAYSSRVAMGIMFALTVLSIILPGSEFIGRPVAPIIALSVSLLITCIALVFLCRVMRRGDPVLLALKHLDQQAS
jgi:hypothetical protein